MCGVVVDVVVWIVLEKFVDVVRFVEIFDVVVGVDDVYKMM